ncbi:MAG: T9SS type A sorting domain-containing protein [Bacteroidales bacterium]|nr:T9SS type A sorting domain-containing protein [Bacteroidales bacterium]
MTAKLLTTTAIIFASCSLMAQPSITIEYECETATLTRSDPPEDIIYYWQGAADGTSQDNSNKTFLATSSGSYFLRAFLASSQGTTLVGSWLSSTFATNVRLNQHPGAPPVPVYGEGSLSLPSPPANVTYFWQGTSCGDDDSNSDATYPVSASGEYFARAFNNLYNCWSLDCSSALVSISDVEDAINTTGGISLAPTPATDQVILYLSEDFKNVDVFLYDINGKMVLSKTDVASNQLIDISALGQGTYIVKFRNEGTDYHQKLMISK